jgi:hypothetical protein
MSGELLAEYRRPSPSLPWFRRLARRVQYAFLLLAYQVFPLPRGAGVRRAFQHAASWRMRATRSWSSRRAAVRRRASFSPCNPARASSPATCGCPWFRVWLGGLRQLRAQGRRCARPGELSLRLGAPLTFDAAADPAAATAAVAQAMRGSWVGCWPGRAPGSASRGPGMFPGALRPATSGIPSNAGSPRQMFAPRIFGFARGSRPRAARAAGVGSSCQATAPPPHRQSRGVGPVSVAESAGDPPRDAGLRWRCLGFGAELSREGVRQGGRVGGPGETATPAGAEGRERPGSLAFARSEPGTSAQAEASPLCAFSKRAHRPRRPGTIGQGTRPSCRAGASPLCAFLRKPLVSLYDGVTMWRLRLLSLFCLPFMRK